MYPLERSRIFFFEVPGRARIRYLYRDGGTYSNIDHQRMAVVMREWNLNTSSRQRIVSEVYIAPSIREFGHRRACYPENL